MGDVPITQKLEAIKDTLNKTISRETFKKIIQTEKNTKLQENGKKSRAIKC